MVEKNTPERIELLSREGRPYATNNPVEASHLVRTRGYRYKASQAAKVEGDGPPLTNPSKSKSDK